MTDGTLGPLELLPTALDVLFVVSLLLVELPLPSRLPMLLVVAFTP